VTDLTRALAMAPASIQDESPGEFQCFRAWLDCSPRPAPATLGAPIAELAARHSWLARAQTFDVERRLGLSTKSPVELLHEAVRLHLETGLNEASKLRALSASSASMVLDPKTAIEAAAKFAELAQSAPPPRRAEAADLSKLTTEELLEWERLTEKATPK
jgi:hypothetical protein